MKRILIYLIIFWFWYCPEVAMQRFVACWLCEDAFCLSAFDFNDDGIVNFPDYAIMVQE
jgi:hypothetical protein